MLRRHIGGRHARRSRPGLSLTSTYVLSESLSNANANQDETLPRLLATLKTLMLNDNEAAAANMAQLATNFGLKCVILISQQVTIETSYGRVAAKVTAGYDPLSPFMAALPAPSYKGPSYLSMCLPSSACMFTAASPASAPKSSRASGFNASHSAGRHQFKLYSGSE